VNTLGIDYAADAAEMSMDSGETCTVGSAAGIACVLGAESRDVEIEPESDEAVFTRSVQIQTADVSSIPALRSKVTVGAVKYAVMDILSNTDEAIIVMHLMRKDIR
jgi:hypothetical protein